MSDIARVAVGIFLATFAFQFSFAKETADVFENGKWQSLPCLELSDVQNFKPQAVHLDKYGGWMEKTNKATGFFHTAIVDGRWWFVDPDGHLFLSVGVDSVGQSSAETDDDTDGAATNVVTDAKLIWANRTLAFLHTNFFNTLGCWGEAQTLRKGSAPMPYCLHWNFMADYQHERKLKYPGTGNGKEVSPFDPEFEKFCDEHAKALAKTKNDPWLLGHFSDNELPFEEKGIVQRFLDYPANDPNHIAAANFLAARHHVKIIQSDDREFLQLVVSEYFRKVSVAIKKYDPNHLFLGCRFHRPVVASTAPFIGAGPYADVISVNYYGHWTPDDAKIVSWASLARKPILMTEWYAKAQDSSLPNTTGAGFLVKSQSDRAKFYQNFTLTLLQCPGCVGWHWFKYRDGADNNPGIVNAKGEPYQTLLDSMRRINSQVYPLKEALGK